MTYLQVYNLIKAALTLRPEGTKVQVDDHETAEIAILDYVEQVKTEAQGSILREAHAAATAAVNCNLTWDVPFVNTNYTHIVNGFDSLGNPVEIYLISRSTTKLVVKTLVNASLTALARPYAG
jgi:hypothetical protein